MKKIILASGSPRRRELLTQIGISFEVVKAEGEEKITTDDPEEAVKELAMQKAQELGDRRPMFLCQSMEELDLYGTVDAAVCALDSLNY